MANTKRNVEFVNLSEMRIPDDVIAAVPHHLAKKYNVVPVFADEMSVVVAMPDPPDLDTIDSLAHLLNKTVTVRVAMPEVIKEAISRYYGARED